MYPLDPRPCASHPVMQNAKDSSVASELALRKYSQEDYPDGGLQAWLVVLGVRLSA